MDPQLLHPKEIGGWARKYSRNRNRSIFSFISNWQNRYFVLSYGKLYYYKDAEKKDKKGSMSLEKARLSAESKYSDKQIYIIKGDDVPDEFDLLMECSDISTASEWKNALEEHINYLALRANPGATSPSQRRQSALSPVARRKSTLMAGESAEAQNVQHPLS